MKGKELKLYEVKLGSVTRTGDNSFVRGFMVLAHDVPEACDKVGCMKKRDEYVETCELRDRIDLD